MSLIPSGYRLVYNDWVFPPHETVTTDFSIEPVELDARTTAYNKYRLQVRTWFEANPTDAQIVEARQRLTKYGQQLIYTGRGLGTDLNINTSASKRDVLWGPKPRLLSFKHMTAGRQAVQIDWAVEWHMPDCSQARYQFFPAALTYRVEFRLRPNGRVDRVVTGALTIPNNRRAPNSRQLNDSPDAYRRDIATPVPELFRREWAPWVVNEARTQLSFGWTDSEFGGEIFPPGVVACRANQSTHSTDRGLVSYVTTINAEYDLAAGYDYKSAFNHFFTLVKDRIKEREKEQANKHSDDKVSYLPISYKVDEHDLFGDPKCGFSLTYTVTNSSIENVIKDAGMFLVSKDSERRADWKKWQESMTASAHNPEGYSKMVMTRDEDRVIDLCGFDNGRPVTIRIAQQEKLFKLFPFPHPEAAWLMYENHLRLDGDSGLAVMQTLPTKELKPAKQGDMTVELKGTGPNPGQVGGQIIGQLGLMALFGKATNNSGFGAVGGSSENPNSKTPDAGGEAQRRVRPTVYLFMYGRAMRAGYEVPCPELKSLDDGAGGTITPIPANRPDRGEGFTKGLLWNAGRIPVYGAKWNIRYWLPRVPKGGLPSAPNPMLDYDGKK